MALRLTLNGVERDFGELEQGASLSSLLVALTLKSDRVAVELNGAIVSRELWSSRALHESDRLEIVHFVGGGCRPLRTQRAVTADEN